MHPRPCPRLLHSALLLSLLLNAANSCRAQAPAGTAFTYHGVLSDNGVPASGSFDLRFTLYNALAGGSAIGSPVVVPSVTILSGAFVCEVDFGVGAFDGSERWIEVAARRTGEAAYTTLSPRQKVTRLPYAGLSLSADGLTGVLPIASGGTGSAVKSFVDLTSIQTIGGAKAFTGQVSVNGSLQSSTGTLELWTGGRRLYRLEDDAASPNLIGGDSSSTVSAGVYGATIAGGGFDSNPHRVTDHFGTIGGGGGNQVGDNAGSVNDCLYATVGGGERNTASGSHATVGGGFNNIASGDHSTVVGGIDNTAAGNYSFATGRQAKANHIGAFVWADAGLNSLSSSSNNEFTVRASGGVRFFTNATATTGVRLTAGDGSWDTVSDRNLKHAFRSLDPESVLDRLASIPVSEWSYTAQDPSIRHVGPTAQDFHSAFGLGTDDRHIGTIDADGVLMAAMQGLHRRLRAKDQEIEILKRENAGQNHRIEALRRENAVFRAEMKERVDRLESLLKRSTMASGSEAAR